jgi:hypothetical protein
MTTFFCGATPRVVVHEIGHSFDWSNDGFDYDVKDGLAVAGLRNRNSGFAGPLNRWQFSDQITDVEIFADMFVGWVYGRWDPIDRSRGAYMDRMAPYIRSHYGR